MSAADLRACGCSDAEIAAFAGASGPCWGFSPAVPTRPGLYVISTFGPSPRAGMVHWSEQSRDWRHGARLERVDAFFGPIELPLFDPAHPPASPARARDPYRSNRP